MCHAPLKLNVGNEATAVKFDAKMKTMTEKMKAHPGFTHATRYVCKVERVRVRVRVMRVGLGVA